MPPLLQSEYQASPDPAKLKLQLAGVSTANGSMGTPRRLYKTPFGDGILTHIRPNDGTASVSLSWGAVLYCPAYLLGISPEQVDDFGGDDEVAPLPAHASSERQRRRLSSTDSHGKGQEALIRKLVNQVPPGMEDDEYYRSMKPKAAAAAASAPIQRTETPPKPPTVAKPAPLPFRSVKVVTECVVQLELMGAVSVITDSYLSCLSNENVTALIDTLENSIEFARKFNADRCGAI